MSPATISTPSNPTTALDEPTETLVRVRVCRLIGRFGFNESDRDDLEQELRLHLLRCRDRFDPSRVAWSTYAGGTVDMHIKELIRARMAPMRDYRRGQSGGLDGGTGATDVHQIADTAEDQRVQQRDLRLDLVGVLAGLDEEDRELCVLLASKTSTEVARLLNVTRWTIYDRIAVLRQRFAAAGLEVYL